LNYTEIKKIFSEITYGMFFNGGCGMVLVGNYWLGIISLVTYEGIWWN